MRRIALAALLLVALVGACSRHEVAMSYNSAAVAAKPAMASPSVETVTVTDLRGTPANRLGAIRGGYGNPLKTLETAQPVKDVLHQAFADGLSARGMLAPNGNGRYGLEITIEKLDCSQYVRREAHTKLQVALLEKGTGRQVYTKRVEDNRTDSGSLVATGIFGSVDGLRKIANDSMQAAVDQALDNPAFLAVIGAR